MGYPIAVQSPDGVIHLITSMNEPCLHFEMNEEWVLDKANQAESPRGSVEVAEQHVEHHPDGKPRVIWSSGTDCGGRPRLHGTETWYAPDGGKLYEAQYVNGVKAGTETYRAPDGPPRRIRWTKRYGADGEMVWTQYWPGGPKKSESH